MGDRYTLTTDQTTILEDGYAVALVDPKRPVDTALRIIGLLNLADSNEKLLDSVAHFSKLLDSMKPTTGAYANLSAMSDYWIVNETDHGGTPRRRLKDQRAAEPRAYLRTGPQVRR